MLAGEYDMQDLCMVVVSGYITTSNLINANGLPILKLRIINTTVNAEINNFQVTMFGDKALDNYQNITAGDYLTVTGNLTVFHSELDIVAWNINYSKCNKCEGNKVRLVAETFDGKVVDIKYGYDDAYKEVVNA